MTTLYNLRPGPQADSYQITRFTPDLEPEQTYDLSARECTCPAGSKSTCRHRKMLPLFLQHHHVADGWFLDWDTRLWRHPTGDVATAAEALADEGTLGKSVEENHSVPPELGAAASAPPSAGQEQALPRPPAEGSITRRRLT